MPRLLSTYARELKEVAQAFLLLSFPWERNVLFLLGTTYLLGISLFRSFDFFSNCGSLASTACLGYFFLPPVPLLLLPGEKAGWKHLQQPWPEAMEGWGQQVSSSFVCLCGVSKKVMG